MQRSSGFLFSVIFHLSLVVLVVFWPASAPRKTEPYTGALVQGIVTIGKAGGPAKKTVQDTAKNTGTVGRVKDPEPTPQTPPTSQPRVEPEAPVTPPKDVKHVEKIQEPTPPPEKVTAQKKVEPDAVKISEKREDKPKEKKEPETKKTETKKTVKQDKTPQKKTAPPKSEKKGSAASQALADLGKSEKKKTPKGGTSAADALKSFESELGGGDGSGTATGSGYGEGGYGDSLLVGSYIDSLVSRIKPNWEWTRRTDRRVLKASFLIKVGADGRIESHSLVDSSGNPSFDSSVTKAIVLTNQVEPPPPSIPNGEILVIFSSDEAY